MSTPTIIWIATYPKSGTTWVRSLLSALRDPDKKLDINSLTIPSAANRNLIDSCLGIKTSDLSREEMRAFLPAAFRFWSQNIQGIGFLKTHDAYRGTKPEENSIFPADVSIGVIHIVRDPRDVAISSRHYFGVSQDEAIEYLNDPGRWILTTRPYLQLPTFISDWSTHATSWLDSPLRRLTLRYEDLLADTAGELRKIVNFCGWDIPEEQIAYAVEACAFSRLQEQERNGGYSCHSIARAAPFFRSGRSGQWRNILTQGQIEHIVNAHRGVMRRLGYQP